MHFGSNSMSGPHNVTSEVHSMLIAQILFARSSSNISRHKETVIIPQEDLLEKKEKKNYIKHLLPSVEDSPSLCYLTSIPIYLTLPLELIQFVSNVAVSSKVYIQLLTIQAELLFVQASRALKRVSMLGILGNTKHAVTTLFFAAEIQPRSLRARGYLA